jgi:beta-lactamase superfamily II metal-dependent hydrolase
MRSSVHFIDVGQGDAIRALSDSSRHLVIDSGELTPTTRKAPTSSKRI